MANADSSIPNLSSIMFLAEAESKANLFTGDGRGDHLLDGLDDAGLLDAQGSDVKVRFCHCWPSERAKRV
jgi:hypothetical protein